MEEKGECRFRRRSASETRAGSMADSKEEWMDVGAGGGILVRLGEEAKGERAALETERGCERGGRELRGAGGGFMSLLLCASWG
jgi:hypothetical protein